MECPQIDLYEFLTESELQHYYNAIKNELKITNAAQFKYANDEDLRSIGLSRPEIRRLRKYYEKYFPHGYLSKIKRLLQAPSTMVKRDGNDGSTTFSPTSLSQSTETLNSAKLAANSPSKIPNNKHIIPADAISVNKQLGTGEFGIVQQGVWTNGTERIQVAIKCLCRERMQSNPMEFLKEAAIMHSIEHENIVRLYGVVLATDSLMLVTELAHLRSLLECLKDPGLRVSFLTISTLCEFAMQICNGMSYLEHKRLIHRDLAARNILVFSKNKVKISDFGLSRALGVGKDYYKTNFNVNLKLPIAWCAPECINYLRFTNASDMWAYGVCLWEMFSYGFQPWAALTGLQILEAIDGPNYQRLEQPDCCPQEYYTLMMKCWQDDPAKRPKFSEIFEMLPDMKPEQLKTVANSGEPKKDHLIYRQGEIITVLDRNTGTPFWKGVLNSGKTGYFNPSNTVAFLEGLPSSNRDSFCRISERSSKRKLRTEMISKPQNDFKHTLHVGPDGASFGDVSFLSNSQSYNHVPRQIVTPYKPSEDIEQTPLLLPPTPTSPDSFQTASAYFPESSHATQSLNPTFVSSAENTPKKITNKSQSSFEFPSHEGTMMPQINTSTNPFANKHDLDDANATSFAMANNNYGINAATTATNTLNHRHHHTTPTDALWRSSTMNTAEEPHEYHEISDDEITTDKLDFGPSLLDEINSMFGSMSAATTSKSKSPDVENTNIKNEFTEITCKVVRKNSGGGAGGCSGGGGGGGGDTNGNRFSSSSHKNKNKTAGTVKPISVKDAKILNQAIEIANEISAKSMTDLVADPNTTTTQSPKRKFSFRFPHLNSGGSCSNTGSGDKFAVGNSSSGLGSGGIGGCGSSGGGGGGSGNISQFKSASPNARKKNFTEEIENIPDLQEIIDEDAREAYNSLIERKSALANVPGLSMSPAATLLRHFDTNEFAELATAKTLPRRSMQMAHEYNHQQHHQQHQQQQHRQQTQLQQQPAHGTGGSIPFQHAPRPMTLPSRGINGKMRHATDLKRSCTTNNDIGKENALPLDGDGGSPCESPSYLTHASYKFSTTTEHANEQRTAAAASATANPIPLPPRDGKNHIKANPKRHVRKYPLIIPANGVQRTLNMMTSGSDGGGGGGGSNHGIGANGSDTKRSSSTNQAACNVLQVVASIRQPSVVKASVHDQLKLHLDGREVAGKVITAASGTAAANVVANVSHVYQNLEATMVLPTTSRTSTTPTSPPPACDDDSASLQFESILEANKGQVLQSPDVTDGFYNFSIQKEQYNKAKDMDFDAQKKISGLYVNEDELRNLDIDTTTTPSPPAPTSTAAASTAITTTTPLRQKPPRGKKPNDCSELAGNVLFQKARDAVDFAMCSNQLSNAGNNGSVGSGCGGGGGGQLRQHEQTEAEYFAQTAARLASSNSVSCEDLLEFCDKKPKGCERGVDSDEVRIMMKVLGKASTPTRCLHVLEFIDWDVHKAIKIIKLQNILASIELDLNESVEVLQQHEWDLHATALKVKGLKV